MNHVNAIQDNPGISPKSYWEDTSHNGILRTFIEIANNGQRPELDVNDKFETLLAGGYVEESIEENLSYDRLHSSDELKKGYRTVLCYGIAFFDKQCLVKKSDERHE